MKSGSIGDSNMYLGAKLRKFLVENGVKAWATSALKYLQEAVCNSVAYLNDYFGDQKFAMKVIHPFESDYDPLIDSSALL